MLPQAQFGGRIASDGHAPRDGCVTAAGHSQGTVRQLLFVRNRSFGSVQCPRAAVEQVPQTNSTSAPYRDDACLPYHDDCPPLNSGVDDRETRPCSCPQVGESHVRPSTIISSQSASRKAL